MFGVITVKKNHLQSIKNLILFVRFKLEDLFNFIKQKNHYSKSLTLLQNYL